MELFHEIFSTNEVVFIHIVLFAKQRIFFELTIFKMTFRDRIVVREHRFRALVLQNHPKNIRLFEQYENNLT
jgi:hypothetical protein